jgi:DNA transposition AAA+ family ATPase
MHKIARTRNIRELTKLYQALEGRSKNVPGIGLVVGEAGIGKTTSVTWLQNQTNCVVVECSSLWTPYSMLSDIADDLGVANGGGAQRLLNRLVERFAATRRGLVLDEAEERLFLPGRKHLQMVDVLRSIHDRTGVPLVFVGYQKMLRTVTAFPQLEGRVSQSCEFERLDFEDTKLFVEAIVPGLTLTPDLQRVLFTSTQGRPRQTITAVENLRNEAAANQWEVVGVAEWGDRKFFPGDKR